MSEETSLKDVVDRLDQLISLWKLANRDTIKKIKKEIEKDPVSKKILELSDGTREYGALVEEVAKVTGKSTRTVERRISDLVEMSVIRSVRKGKQVFYEKTGLYD